MALTTINIRTLSSGRGGLVPMDTIVTATPSRPRVEGADVILPKMVVLELKKGTTPRPLILEAPTAGWAWGITVSEAGRVRNNYINYYVFPGGVTIDFEDMTPVEPITLTPLLPAPINVLDALNKAVEANAASAVTLAAATDNLAVANTAVVSGAVVVDDLVLTRKNGQTINAGNVRGPIGAAVPWGVNIGATDDLNSYTADGVYRQATNANATLERNYPLASNGGLLEVFRIINTDNLMQRFTVYNGTSYNRGPFTRRKIGGSWGSWVFTGSSRTDKTSGIAVYSWDEVAQREQLTYGDTGLRTINTELGVTSGNVYIRRRGYEVTVSFVNAVFGTLAGQQDLPALPTGWRPQVNSNSAVFLNLTANRCVAISTGVLRIYGLVAGASVDGTFTFTTNNGWPSSLIGSVNGGIPNI